MSELRKAAQRALEILDWINSWDGKQLHIKDAEVLRAALAQPEPEPWMGISDNPYCNDHDCNDPNGRALRWHNKLQTQRKPLTTNEVEKIINDNTDSDGICCADDLLAAIKARSNT